MLIQNHKVYPVCFLLTTYLQSAVVSIKRNIKTNVSIMPAIIYNHWLIFYSLYYTLFSYLGTVLMLLFAAEAVNLFVRIVLVFSEIERYVIKATLIACSKQLKSRVNT